MTKMSDKKKIEELTFNDDISYYEEHTWEKVEENQIRVGISDFAQDQLGDIIFIELPEVGTELAKGEVFGQAESTKTVSALYMPVSGKIIEVNEELESDPELVNNSPYDEGWMIVIEPNDLTEMDALLTKDGYINVLKNNG
jgi:glycine cleavage system H protein